MMIELSVSYFKEQSIWYIQSYLLNISFIIFVSMFYPWLYKLFCLEKILQ